ncbi:phosphoribosylanthranilate isomerase [Methanoplanus limicola]|uniref:N-(5'-phosphoribosyl)anthranilate isomerase n=1 Tax=Methanoplanus limicola DSM 2279 TaxID=937775 RepID=H1Z0Z1_9EURY|nr:phosphoribosylanthranilate isomerase [Methanoplanus limicola]EHQ34467.1 phosphoribosylanthranilate isomerase [Methanoplanus limicola DSM 2279]
MRVKICGITDKNDALFAETSGADAVGVVISGESKRNVTAGEAKEIFSVLGPFVSTVIVTHTESEDEMREIAEVNPSAIQVSTDVRIPDSYRGKIIRVVSDKKHNPEELPKNCDAIIIDSSRGEGSLFSRDFAEKVIKNSDVPVILAGGLNPENVGEAIRKLSPYAVDVCSGVEESPGIKDRFLVLNFLKAAGKLPVLKRKKT